MPFLSNFKNLWKCNINTEDLQKENSIVGFKELKETIVKTYYEEQENGYGLKAALSKTFIQNIDDILSFINSKIEEEK